MRAFGLALACAAALTGIVGYVLNGQLWLLLLAGAGVVVASGGYVLLRGNPRRW